MMANKKIEFQIKLLVIIIISVSTTTYVTSVNAPLLAIIVKVL